MIADAIAGFWSSPNTTDFRRICLLLLPWPVLYGLFMLCIPLSRYLFALDNLLGLLGLCLGLITTFALDKLCPLLMIGFSLGALIYTVYRPARRNKRYWWMILPCAAEFIAGLHFVDIP